jgi:monoterpene epsilon-lactone hydrolase
MKLKHSAVVALALTVAAPAFAQQAGSIDADGSVNVPAFKLPPSIYASDEAKKAMPRRPTDMEAPMIAALAAGRAGEMRTKVGEFMKGKLDRLKATYGVTTRTEMLGPIPLVHMVPNGMPAANAHKILLNLPGGGFVMGTADGTGSIEGIPLAALAKVEVVSMTYRQGPEHWFPAASEDVATVYRELLKTHKPQDIAVFGCSAGGLLTAESMAWFLKDKLPLPGAAGIFCASADARWGGDSRAYGRPFQALPAADRERQYFHPGDEQNPLASPILTPDVLRKFPPTLVITATRAPELSSAVNTHRELVKAGVEADLHVWDGLGHAFFYDASLPESREAFDVMARFFRKHLKLAQ